MEHGCAIKTRLGPVTWNTVKEAPTESSKEIRSMRYYNWNCLSSYVAQLEAWITELTDLRHTCSEVDGNEYWTAYNENTAINRQQKEDSFRKTQHSLLSISSDKSLHKLEIWGGTDRKGTTTQYIKDWRHNLIAASLIPRKMPLKSPTAYPQGLLISTQGAWLNREIWGGSDGNLTRTQHIEDWWH